MTRVTDPAILASFRRDGTRFVSRSQGGPVSCPPYIIASRAKDFIDLIDLPDGYDSGVLSQIMFYAGFVNCDLNVSGRQADELAQIGTQLLAPR